MAYSFDPKDDVEEQWRKWQEANPPESFIDIKEDDLREQTIKDLAYVSQMDVKEYTLYQKWCEIKEKYPSFVNNTLFGEEIQLLDPKQQILVDEVKSNIWLPQTADDYLNIEPVIIYTDDSSSVSRKGVDGTVIEDKIKRSDLPERWNTARNFISTMKNNSNIGRNLNFLVADNKTGKYLGVMCISSDFLDLTPRDTAIGWPRELKTQGGMINHTAIGSTIVPLQPLGYSYMGGKLLALLCLADTVQKDWKERYGDTLVGVTTTSLYGKTKANGLSQYDGLEHWQKMGFSSGSVAFEPSRSTRNMVFDWIKENEPRKYFEWYVAKKSSGQPYKRDHKNRSLNYAYSKLGIPKELIRTEHQRGIYFSPLYNNTNEFLRKEIGDPELVKSFDTSEETLSNIWKTKYAKGRIRQLQKQNKVSYENLFYDDLIYLSWDETKAKYLPQVGR
jgi:hypothetical protein